MKISLVFLGTTGAGPVYSLEMAKALASNNTCELQVIISENISNLKNWISVFQDSNVNFHVIKTYKHSKISALLSMLNVKKMNNIIKLVKFHNSEVLYLPFGLLWSHFIFKKLYKSLRIVITLHDVQLHDSFHNIIEYALRKLSDKSRKYVSDIVILNRKDLSIVQKKYNKNVVVIPHASFSYYAKKNLDKMQNIKKCIGFFGRIEPYKGLDILIHAFEELQIPDLKLIIAGSGNIDNKILKIITNDNRITLINRYIADDEFQSLMNQIDFVVLPYKRASQSGVIPMAYAFGKTVIATNVGALSEQVTSHTGILTEPNSTIIAQKIKDLYLEPEKIILLGENARNYANTEMTWEHSADLLLNYLKKKI